MIVEIMMYAAAIFACMCLAALSYFCLAFNKYKKYTEEYILAKEESHKKIVEAQDELIDNQREVIKEARDLLTNHNKSIESIKDYVAACSLTKAEKTNILAELNSTKIEIGGSE